MVVLLASSGGGGYAAALLFYFLQYIDTIQVNHQQTMLDKLSLMSVVSGSAVTGMDYALRGREIFDDFEENFLKVNVEDQVRSTVLGGFPRTLPSLLRFLFTRVGETYLLSNFFDNYYSKALYKDVRKDGPEVVVNMSCPEVNESLYATPEYFSIFGRDLSTFSVADSISIAISYPSLLFGLPFEVNPKGDRQLGREYLERYDSKEVHLNFHGFSNKFRQLKKLMDEDNPIYLHLRDAGISEFTGLSYILEQLIPGGDLYEKIVSGSLTRLVVFNVQHIGPVSDLSGINSPRIRGNGFDFMGQTFLAYQPFMAGYVRNLLEVYKHKYGLESFFIDISNTMLEEDLMEQLHQVPVGSFGLTQDQLNLVRDTLPTILERNPAFQRLSLELQKELTQLQDKE